MNTKPFVSITLLSAGLLAVPLSCGQSEEPAPAPSQSQIKNTPDSSPATPKATQQTPDPTPEKSAKTPEQLKERLKLQRVNAMSTSIQFKLMPQLAKLQSNTIPLAHQQILYTILANTNELAIHQMRGQTENRVYINDDGREAVYDKDGELVQDGFNDGSYNYAHGQNEPLLHYILDTSPWILWGMNEKDPTTIEERTYAYMGDLEGGIRKANAMLPFKPLPENHTWPEVGQMQALAIFVKAIELGQAEEIYDLFEVDHQITDKEIIRVLTKLNTGFDLLYNIPGS